jgi:hypothetical protein
MIRIAGNSPQRDENIEDRRVTVAHDTIQQWEAWKTDGITWS